jgi:hypothetical protein
LTIFIYHMVNCQDIFFTSYSPVPENSEIHRRTINYPKINLDEVIYHAESVGDAFLY